MKERFAVYGNGKIKVLDPVFINGLLIGFLFSGENGVDLDGAIAMLRHWLFGDAPQHGPGECPQSP